MNELIPEKDKNDDIDFIWEKKKSLNKSLV